MEEEEDPGNGGHRRREGGREGDAWRGNMLLLPLLLLHLFRLSYNLVLHKPLFITLYIILFSNSSYILLSIFPCVSISSEISSLLLRNSQYYHHILSVFLFLPLPCFHCTFPAGVAPCFLLTFFMASYPCPCSFIFLMLYFSLPQTTNAPMMIG